MTREEALAFLRAHQPMPPDDDITEELAAMFEWVREYFVQNPDPSCIPLFLNSMGEGSCFGVFQLVDKVLYKYSPSVVVPHLADALGSSNRGVRCWAAEFSIFFPDPRLLGPLVLLLCDDDPDTRESAAAALGGLPSGMATIALERALARESDPFVAEAMGEALGRSR